LLQLVAIKRLQARGASLSGIQQQLLGLGDAALHGLARLPEAVETSTTVSPTPPTALREPFWTTTPSPSGGDGDGAKSDSEAPAVLQGVRLDKDATLLVSAARPVDDDDLQAIRAAAAPLLKLLETRRLLGPPKQKETS